VQNLRSYRRIVVSAALLALVATACSGGSSGTKGVVPAAKHVSNVRPHCITPDACPDPTPPPETDPAATFSGSTAQADAIAATRGTVCTQSFSTNGYPGAQMTYDGTTGNSWTLTYRAGYPLYNGPIDNDFGTLAITFVDGTVQQVVVAVKQVYSGATTSQSMYYTDALSKVKYAEIKVVDYAGSATNTIIGLATVTCRNDSGVTVDPPPIRGPTDPPGNGWGDPVLRPLGPA
jgi:hypothetical protein